MREKNKDLKFETLKKNSFSKKLVIGAAVGTCLGLTLNLTTSHSKYRLVDNIDFVEDIIRVNKAKGDLNVLAINIKDGSGNYIEVDELPTDKSYNLIAEDSYCEIKQSDGTYAQDNSITLKYDSGTKGLLVTPMDKKGTRCYLYFDSAPLSAQTLTKLGLTSKGALPTSAFSSVETGVGGIYEMEDDDGTSYYFRGAVTNNYVRFAGKCWRIIRINGDGSIRLIYDSSSETCKANGGGEKLSDTAFNTTYNDAKYVGFTYDGTNSSTIKNTLDTWYATNLASYESKIDKNAGFCGDRSGNTSAYGAYNRLINAKTPSLKCPNSNNDLYTVMGSSNGNKVLTNPIGLITADEVSLAGGVYSQSNQTYYLDNGFGYWTMSPSSFSSSTATVFTLEGYAGSGSLGFSLVSSSSRAIRPVINISADVTISSATGTQSDPFVVS